MLKRFIVFATAVVLTACAAPDKQKGKDDRHSASKQQQEARERRDRAIEELENSL